MTYQNHPLIEAARYVDAQGTEHGVEAFVEKIGLDVETLMHACEQRAMRLSLLNSRGEDAMREITNSIVPVDVRMSRDEIMLLQLFLPAFIDGILIGWEARRLSEGN